MADYTKLKELAGQAKTGIVKTQIDGEGNSKTYSFGDNSGHGLVGDSPDGVSIEGAGNGRIFTDEKLENEDLFDSLSSNIEKNKSDISV